jgi:translation elongation factor EF-Tu-like GTPase
MAELSRKEISKIICKHLRKDSLVDGVNETYLIASVMDALKEIKEHTTTESEDIPIIHGKAELELHDKEVRAKVIEEFAEKLKWEFKNSIGISNRVADFTTAIINMVADQLKEE